MAQVLIVEADKALSRLWARHIGQGGAAVTEAETESAAIDALIRRPIDAIVLDLALPGGSALAIAEFASYRRPQARIVFLTGQGYYADGSIFRLAPNAGALLQTDQSPEDIAAIVEYQMWAH